MTSHLRAPPGKVFRTWTDAALIPKWFMAVPGYLPALAEVALEERGAWRITVRPGDDESQFSHFHGYFFAVEQGRLLEYSWRGDVLGAEHTTLVRVTFEEEGDGSLVRLTHGVFETEAGRAAHAQGWNLCIEGLARAVEGE
jgi:uncharacterized protein YndB with AHSA1/START domain